MTKRLILLLVVLAVIPIALLLIGLAVWTTATSPSGGVGAQPIPATPARFMSTPELSTPQPTAAAIPDDVNPERLTLPPDAKLRTVDQAVDLARQWAKQESTTEPRLILVRLETLNGALASHELQANTHPSVQVPGEEGQRPVWRVVFAGTFFIPSCPAPVNSATPDNCGVTSSVRYVIDAVTAQDYSKTYGVIAIPSATP